VRSFASGVCAHARAVSQSLCAEISFTVDVNDRAAMLRVIASALGTKFAARWSAQMCALSLDAGCREGVITKRLF
jgi:hypothetical protein